MARTISLLLALLLPEAIGACSSATAEAPGGAGGSGGAGGITSVGATAGNASSGGSSVGASGMGASDAGAASGGTSGAMGGASSAMGGASPSSGAGGAVTGGAGGAVAAGGASNPSRPAKVLIYAIATAFDHASIPAAATAIAQAASGAGLTVDTVPADVTTSNNKVPVPGDFTPQALAAYGAVVLLSTSGEPLGSPGTMEIKALDDFVTSGGGLVAINNANHAYDSSTKDPSTTYISLLGADFNGQTPYGAGTCAPVGSHQSNAMLPQQFDITDEVYNFKNVNPDIQVVLECKDSPTAAARPVSWVRTQGAGRVFYTSLGKQDHSWTPPDPLVPKHVLPGLLWTMGRQ